MGRRKRLPHMRLLGGFYFHGRRLLLLRLLEVWLRTRHGLCAGNFLVHFYDAFTLFGVEDQMAVLAVG